MKKSYKIKFTVIIIILILQLVLTQTFISCGGNNNNNTDNPNNGVTDNVKTADNSAGTTATPLDELYPYPDHDFGGAAINILARKDDWAEGSQDIADLAVDSLTGEVLNDAVYNRTKAVEDKYNVQLNVAYSKDPTTDTTKSVKAGDDAYQLIQEKLMFMESTLATQNYLTDFQTVKSINLDAPWYNQNAIKDLSINKKVTALGGDMTVNDKGGVIMLVFNKKLQQQYGIEDLYATVRDGKWTLDKLYDLIVQTTADLNGDGKYTFNDDQWGLVCEDYGGWMFAAGSGDRLANLDTDGIPYMTCTDEKTVSDYQRIMKIMYEKVGRVVIQDDVQHVNIFTDNRCFLSMDMLSSIAMLRGMTDDFGIIPVPKQDETQANYITTISPWVSRFIAMPSTCGNPEMVGAVADAMSRESANTVVPAYYDNLLNQKIARDDESIEMLKDIFASVVYDIGSVFNWGGIWDLQYTFFNTKQTDYVSFYEKNQGKVEAAMQKTIDTMQQSN
ncbi:MAG: hypothetical protein FWD71_22385 [Oscillospiraceae bacterium]|nr:hypothetical protein [Oscillospiraceae bacterium]